MLFYKPFRYEVITFVFSGSDQQVMATIPELPDSVQPATKGQMARIKLQQAGSDHGSSQIS